MGNCKSAIKKRLKNEWIRRIFTQKGAGKKYADVAEEHFYHLIMSMKKGHAMIAYQRQDGSFCMCIGTLETYKQFFNKELCYVALKNTIPYWDEEQEEWRTFRTENLLSWKDMGY